jgi:hypothetical protein
MVEFSLVVSVLTLVLLCLMYLGIMFGTLLDLKGATRDSARRAAVMIGRPDAVTLAKQSFDDQLSLTEPADATYTLTPAPPWEHGDVVTVRASTPHRVSVLGVTFWSGTLRAESEIRVE